MSGRRHNSFTHHRIADLVVEAIVRRPIRIATRLGIFGAVAHAIAPRPTQIMLNTAFNVFPDSAADKGKKDGGGEFPRSSWRLRSSHKVYTGRSAPTEA